MSHAFWWCSGRIRDDANTECKYHGFGHQVQKTITQSFELLVVPPETNWIAQKRSSLCKLGKLQFASVLIQKLPQQLFRHSPRFRNSQGRRVEGGLVARDISLENQREFPNSFGSILEAFQKFKKIQTTWFQNQNYVNLQHYHLSSFCFLEIIILYNVKKGETSNIDVLPRSGDSSKQNDCAQAEQRIITTVDTQVSRSSSTAAVNLKQLAAEEVQKWLRRWSRD